MVPRVAAGRGRQRPSADGVFPLEGGDRLRQSLAGRLAVDCLPEAGQLVGRQVVVAGGRHQSVRVDLDVVELPALALGDRALARLVRTLVGAEPHVAVGPEDLELTEFARQLIGQREHRPAHRLS